MFDLCERHYEVLDLAETWNVHPCTVRRIFSDEPGVLKITKRKKGKRRWVMLRIPESVAKRVYDRLTQGGGSWRA
jgi:hypothetical protein